MQNLNQEPGEASADASILAESAQPADPTQPAGAAAPPAPNGKKKKKKPTLKVRIEHHTKGRVRLKVSSAKGDVEQLQEIGKTFSSIPGVQRITVKPETGSVVLHYDVDQQAKFQDHFSRRWGHPAAPPPTELDELADKIEREAEFLAEHSHSVKAIVHICKRLDREIKVKTNNTVDLKIGLAAGVIGLTLLEVGATAATPVWLTLSVFTLNHFVELQQRESMLEKAKAEGLGKAPVIVKPAKSEPSA
jgi:hypothetical protein